MAGWLGGCLGALDECMCPPAEQPVSHALPNRTTRFRVIAAAHCCTATLAPPRPSAPLSTLSPWLSFFPPPAIPAFLLQDISNGDMSVILKLGELERMVLWQAAVAGGCWGGWDGLELQAGQAGRLGRQAGWAGSRGRWVGLVAGSGRAGAAGWAGGQA